MCVNKILICVSTGFFVFVFQNVILPFDTFVWSCIAAGCTVISLSVYYIFWSADEKVVPPPPIPRNLIDKLYFVNDYADNPR